MEAIIYPEPASTYPVDVQVTDEKNSNLYCVYKVFDDKRRASRVKCLQSMSPRYYKSNFKFLLKLRFDDVLSHPQFQSLDPEVNSDRTHCSILKSRVDGEVHPTYGTEVETAFPISLSDFFSNTFESGLISFRTSNSRNAQFGFFGCLISFSESTVVLENPEISRMLHSLGPLHSKSLLESWQKKMITASDLAKKFPSFELTSSPVHLIHIKRIRNGENYFNITVFYMKRYFAPVGLGMEWNTFAIHLTEETADQLKRSLSTSDSKARRICLAEPDQTMYIAISPCSAENDCSSRVLPGYDIYFSDQLLDFNPSLSLASVEPSIPVHQYHPELNTGAVCPYRSAHPLSDLEQEALEQIPCIRNLTEPGQVAVLLSRLCKPLDSVPSYGTCTKVPQQEPDATISDHYTAEYFLPNDGWILASEYFEAVPFGVNESNMLGIRRLPIAASSSDFLPWLVYGLQEINPADLINSVIEVEFDISTPYEGYMDAELFSDDHSVFGKTTYACGGIESGEKSQRFHHRKIRFPYRGDYKSFEGKTLFLSLCQHPEMREDGFPEIIFKNIKVMVNEQEVCPSCQSKPMIPHDTGKEVVCKKCLKYVCHDCAQASYFRDEGRLASFCQFCNESVYRRDKEFSSETDEYDDFDE
ncbi:hypothetical protein ACWJJH_02640 [Endozoicomonadaceae bacterium StTr2]